MSTVISVENLSKSYRLGLIGGGTLREDLARWWARARKMPDPNLRIGEEHHARLIGQEFWALQDVSFQVKEGEILGIIGRNGAGKSTLLKILSRVTAPTSGYVKIKGRIASLLEVGTGFHPELTGRENVFLNGAILGMTKAEIRRKFDEIVAFSEIEEFIDTPVKRYSSGMYVRLAFAVAAHLEPEILIVDEVLAVGDAQFQKKCLGRMQTVAGHGRTILFVSHTMTAVRALTNRIVLMDQGRALEIADKDEAIRRYLEISSSESENIFIIKNKATHAAVSSIKLLNSDGTKSDFYTAGTTFSLEIRLTTDGAPRMSLELFLCDINQTRLAIASLYQLGGVYLPEEAGEYLLNLHLEPLWLASGAYSLDLATSQVDVNWDQQVTRALVFEVPLYEPARIAWHFKQSDGNGALAWFSQKESTTRFIPVKSSAAEEPARGGML